LEIFTLHHCALNRGCGGWVSSCITVCYMFQGRPLDRLCALNPDSQTARTTFVSKISLRSSYHSCWPPEVK